MNEFGGVVVNQLMELNVPLGHGCSWSEVEKLQIRLQPAPIGGYNGVGSSKLPSLA